MTTIILLVWVTAALIALRRRSDKTRTLAWKIAADTIWLAWSAVYLGAGNHLGAYGAWTGYLWAAFAVFCLGCGGAQLNDHIAAWQRARHIDLIVASSREWYRKKGIQ